MKVLLDTNIIVDFLSKRPVFFNEAEKIISKCRDGEIIGIVAVHTVSTLFYLLKKYVLPETLRDIFYNLFEIIEIGRADKNSVLEALKNTEFTDFEDGLQYQCALEEFIDCIITRNKKDFFSSKIPVYTPSEFLKSL